MKLEVHDGIDDIPAEQWNALNPDEDPFLRHEFLAALEHNGCVTPRFGWRPRHLAIWDGGRLLGAASVEGWDKRVGDVVLDQEAVAARGRPERDGLEGSARALVVGRG